MSKKWQRGAMRKENGIEQMLQDAREGLVPLPVSGEAWDERKSYITGDIVTENGTAYIALRYSKGKSPQIYQNCWEAKKEEESFPAWADIPDGTVVTEGTQVTEAGTVWRCISQHIKSTVYKPKAGSSKWEAVK